MLSDFEGVKNMDNTVTEVKAYKTTDGALFTDSAAATKHQLSLNLVSGFETFVDEYGYNSMLKDDIVDMLSKNWESLRDILKDCGVISV